MLRPPIADHKGPANIKNDDHPLPPRIQWKPADKHKGANEDRTNGGPRLRSSQGTPPEENDPDNDG